MIDELPYRLPELFIRPLSGFAQQCLEFGENIFNSVQVGAMGGEYLIVAPCASTMFLNLRDLMCRQVVTDDDITGS